MTELDNIGLMKFGEETAMYIVPASNEIIRHRNPVFYSSPSYRPARSILD